MSSAGPEDEHSAASLRERHTSEQAGRRLRSRFNKGPHACCSWLGCFVTGFLPTVRLPMVLKHSGAPCVCCIAYNACSSASHAESCHADGADLPAMSGSSAADKAAHARALADMAWVDARKKVSLHI